MTQGKRYVVLGLAILAAGAVRMPFERQITDDLYQARLLPPKLEQRTGEKIGQTFSAVSLGGLRTLVATFMNLRAFTFFTDLNFFKSTSMVALPTPSICSSSLVSDPLLRRFR